MPNTYNKEYYQTHKAQHLAAVKKWREKNKEHYKKLQRDGAKRRRVADPEKYRKKAREYWSANKKQRLAYHKQWRDTHRETVRASMRRYQRTHKAECNAASRRWVANNLEKRRKIARESARRRYWAKKAQQATIPATIAA